MRSLLFIDMLKLVDEYKKGLKPPIYHETQVSCLKRKFDLSGKITRKYKNERKMNGCTLISDKWMDGNGKSLINFLVNSFASSLSFANFLHKLSIYECL